MRLAGYLCFVAAASAAVMLGCFSPMKPGCAFSCVTDGLCPTAYHCADDGLCHRDDGQGTCSLPSQVEDAGEDAIDNDGSVDGSADAAAQAQPLEAGNNVP
jgi:hypothetical protein